MKRAIHIFPQFDRLHEIERVRKLYDPLFGKIEPHITLVFPFESNLTKHDLEEHMTNSLRSIEPFELVVQEVTGMQDEYLFLNVKTGNDAIIRIRDLLYQGLLNNYRVRRYTYVPHITLGRVTNRDRFVQALEELSCCNEVFKTLVTELTVEIIDSDENSIIESRYFL